jgi:hypothetical protein
MNRRGKQGRGGRYKLKLPLLHLSTDRFPLPSVPENTEFNLPSVESAINSPFMFGYFFHTHTHTHNTLFSRKMKKQTKKKKNKVGARRKTVQQSYKKKGEQNKEDGVRERLDW